MSNKIIYRYFIPILGIIIFGIMGRLLPHPPNFTPVLAICLFSALTIRPKWLTYTVPLIIMMITDMIYGMHTIQLFVYMCIAGSVLIGHTMRHWNKIAITFIGGTFASICFFIVTNFAVWLLGTYYPPTWQGLLTCYVSAIPFFHNTLLGTWIYGVVIFGMAYLVDKIWHLNLFTNIKRSV